MSEPGRAIAPSVSDLLQPPPETLAELASILADDPSLRDVRPETTEATDVVHRVLRRSPSPFFVIRVQVPNRRGVVWVSRLPGTHVRSTEADVAALVAFGIARVFCLVPAFAVNGLHGAHRYLDAAAARFGARFHQMEILDHRVPASDAEFEAHVALLDEALARGENVLVHCVGGCGRTGVLAACAMVRAGMTPKAAIAHFHGQRRCGPETPEQAAYVVRYAQRLETARARAATQAAPPVLRLSIDSEGRPVVLAKGGLGVIQVGRFRISGHRWKRVAVKRFVYAVDDVMALRMQQTVDDLTAAGVRLPKMTMHKLGDGNWVQVAQLFGSRSRGSKFAQPSGFHKTLSRLEREFMADQLARVANAGYLPSADLFLVFRERAKGVIPLDLDLIIPETNLPRLAAELVKRWIQVGTDESDRERLLGIGLPLLRPALALGVRALLSVRDGPYARLWRAF